MMRKFKCFIFLDLTCAGGIGMRRKSQQKSRVIRFRWKAGFSRAENDPLKTCNGLKSLGYCHPDYPWAFQNGKMCCACGRQNPKQVMGKRFSAHCLSEINLEVLIDLEH